MIDELNLLREARPEVSAPDDLTVLRARRAVLRRGLAGRRRRRLRLITVGAAAVAAAVTIGLVVPGTGRPAMAAQLASAHLELHPEVGPSEYLHIKRVHRVWGYGPGPAKGDLQLEYWIPGDGESPWIERHRSLDPRETGRLIETKEFDNWGPKLYVDHADDIPALVEQLKDYAKANDQQRDLHGVWTVAFWVANDPTAPEVFRTKVMNALMSLDGVTIADPDFTSPGLTGKAVTIDGERVWFVVDPQTGAFRGLVGYPEKDKSWVGPEDPMWTTTYETAVVKDAPEAD
ncbi:hypothetical protein [Nocardioides sp.]|uniref:hypothetical protein n=1 Tax=Nocardioides sp. TaxID=35761 RepID=UPI002C82B575|nr:hypothetical protein [Nocardioides sp.]HSX67119.1 hypothetical protein [Nocardioides sp.]